MKRHWFYILLSLAERDRHGSGIARDVLELTDGELHLWPATLYGSLEELVEKGWLDALDEAGRHPEGESERKRYFRITRPGRRALEAESRRMADLVAVTQRRLVRPEEAR